MAAKRALNVSMAGYKVGATTTLEVTDPERTSKDADTSAVIAEDGLRQAELNLLAVSDRFPAR